MFKKLTFVLASLGLVLSSLHLSSCASGGYKLTRQYSRWVNSQNIILRVILYILTLPIYTITLLVDTVLFNTLDFWNGRVAQGTYEFNSEGKTYTVDHKLIGNEQLKYTQIKISQGLQTIETLELLETPTGEIEYKKNGILQAKATDLNSLPQVHIMTADGSSVAKTEYILLQTNLVKK